LALRGDRRKGVGLRADGLPDIDWVDINGGKVMIEIRPDTNPNSPVVYEVPCFVESFRMARFPITIAQFQAFLREYEDGMWRLPPGNVNLPPDGYQPPKLRTRYGNHPADSVNWYDSMAFCYWLSARSGDEVRLPTEFEWQLAATGGDLSRTYPWGPQWDPVKEPRRANTYESGLGRPTAVGMYPDGASPAGVLDMAGTVYEWCLNPFSNSGDSYPVLRGGSCVTGHSNARSAFRFGNNPLNQARTFGFRVVCPSSDTDR
jgi:formylglycine-generating enzyme required for sulfatase activity